MLPQVAWHQEKLHTHLQKRLHACVLPYLGFDDHKTRDKSAFERLCYVQENAPWERQRLQRLSGTMVPLTAHFGSDPAAMIDHVVASCM